MIQLFMSNNSIHEPLLHGEIKPGFEPVLEEFRRNFQERGEVGAACAIFFRGERVVDLWGGYRDYNTKEFWEKETMVPVFSVTKSMCAMALALLHSRGLLNYEEKVSMYWPEFAQNGKENITVRQLITHQAGLSAIEEPITLEMIAHPDELAKVLAKQKPWWNPGDYQGYHAWTMGWYESEIIRRVDKKKRTVGQFFDEEIAKPLGINFYIGLPKEIPDALIARLVPYRKADLLQKNSEMSLKFVLALLNPWSVESRTMLNPKCLNNPLNLNKREILAVEIGSGNGVGNARSIARVFSEFATGGKTLGLKAITLKALEEPPVKPKKGFIDLIWKNDYFIFSLGFMKPSQAMFTLGQSSETFGGHGAGGSVAFSDPKKQIGFAYVANKMNLPIRDPRSGALQKALYECI